VLGFKPGDPGINSRAGHLQKATDTELIPALRVEFHDLEPCLIAVGLRMIGPQLQLLLRRHRTLVPEEFHGFIIDGIRTLTKHNPRQFPIMKATIEGFEPVNLRADIVGDRARPPAPYDLDIAGEESQEPLLAEAPVEHANRIGMRGGFAGALGRRAIGKEHQWANHLVAPLGLIHNSQLQLGKLCGGVHGSPFSLVSGRRVYLYHTGQGVSRRGEGG
jgi:hypothetical protein